MKRSPEAQALLERYRDALSPVPGARERALAELTLRIEQLERAGDPSARESGVRPRSSQSLHDVRPRTSWGARWTSAAIGGGLGLVAVLAWQLATRPAQHASPRLITAPIAQQEPSLGAAAPPPAAASPLTAAETNPPGVLPANAQTAAKNHRPPPARRAASTVHAASEDTSPEDVRGVQPTAAKAVGAAEPRPAAPTLPPHVAQGGELERELRLLRAAYAALRAGHPEIALSRLTEHALRFPHGELAEPRDVAQIMALCQAGQTALARQHAEQFLVQHPSSANAARVRSLCATP